MPWTIWPALVVLWGVCWMFHSGPLPPDQQEQPLDFQVANFEMGGFSGNDSSIDLPDADLPDDTAAFPWDFWLDTFAATQGWGVTDQPVQTDEAAASSNIPAISPATALLYAVTPHRNELVGANQSALDDLSRATTFFAPESVQKS
ncbi:hypothetical protein MKX08_003899 [Trichoderma sp. CBMAI-0020]|nr:hypothetical protein MKX08_003899 [Trichoderma sp. CBMAI-0020]